MKRETDGLFSYRSLFALRVDCSNFLLTLEPFFPQTQCSNLRNEHNQSVFFPSTSQLFAWHRVKAHRHAISFCHNSLGSSPGDTDHKQKMTTCHLKSGDDFWTIFQFSANQDSNHPKNHNRKRRGRGRRRGMREEEEKGGGVWVG